MAISPADKVVWECTDAKKLSKKPSNSIFFLINIGFELYEKKWTTF
jgi:hypothetical protein